MSEVVEVKELTAKGNITVKDGVVKIEYGAVYDKNKDGRASAGGGGYAFMDVPELMEEMAKDQPTMKLLATWVEANKHLLPKIEKEI